MIFLFSSINSFHQIKLYYFLTQMDTHYDFIRKGRITEKFFNSSLLFQHKIVTCILIKLFIRWLEITNVYWCKILFFLLQKCLFPSVGVNFSPRRKHNEWSNTSTLLDFLFGANKKVDYFGAKILNQSLSLTSFLIEWKKETTIEEHMAIVLLQGWQHYPSEKFEDGNAIVIKNSKMATLSL